MAITQRIPIKYNEGWLSFNLSFFGPLYGLYIALAISVFLGVAIRRFDYMQMVPNEYMIPYIAVVIIAAIIAGLLWTRHFYVEHNAKHDLDRESNPIKSNYLAGTGLAIIISAVVVFFATCWAVERIGEPSIWLYCGVAIAFDIIATALTVKAIHESISDSAKWAAQTVKDTAKGVKTVHNAITDADNDDVIKAIVAAVRADLKKDALGENDEQGGSA